MRSRLFLAAVPFLWGVPAANATVHVAIDLTHQRMHVNGDEGSYDWPISSARSGFSTPGGSYAPTHLELMHYSRNTICRRCPTRSSSAVATPSTAPIRRARSAARPPTAACAFRPATRRRFTRWCSMRARASRSAARRRRPRPFAVARNHRSRAYETASYDDGSGYVMPRRSRIYAAPVYSSPVYGYKGYDYGQPVYSGYGASSPFPF